MQALTHSVLPIAFALIITKHALLYFMQAAQTCECTVSQPVSPANGYTQGLSFSIITRPLLQLALLPFDSVKVHSMCAGSLNALFNFLLPKEFLS